MLLPSTIRYRGEEIPEAVRLPDTKKREEQLLMAVIDSVQAFRHLFVTCQKTKKQYLVDTGSNVSVYPRLKTIGFRQSMAYILFAANRSSIPTYS